MVLGVSKLAIEFFSRSIFWNLAFCKPYFKKLLSLFTRRKDDVSATEIPIPLLLSIRLQIFCLETRVLYISDTTKGGHQTSSYLERQSL